LQTTGLNELLVRKCLDVLNVFHAQSGQNLWVNEIVRRVTKTTGSKDSPAIKKSIELLEDASMIQTLPSPQSKQKEIKILTPLGQEVSDFFYHLERCSHSYTRLKNIIIENNITIGKAEDTDEVDKIVERKLLSRRWDRIEIKHFISIMRSAFGMETIYRNNIFNSILHRYSIIRAEHQVNEIADKIIQKIMMNQIQFLFMLTRDVEEVSSRFNEHYFNPETSHHKDIPFVDLYNLISEKIEDYYHEESDLLNKSISEPIEEVTLSLLLLLQPDEQDVQEYIEHTKDLGIRKNTRQEKIISRIKKEDPHRYSHSIEELSIIKLRDIYLKYLEITEKKISNS
jgi:hypothetical protein